MLSLLTGLALELGISLNQPLYPTSAFTNYQEKYGLHVELEKENWFLWGSYADTRNFVLGQRMSDNDVFMGGVGYQFEISEGLRVELGAGWGEVEHTNDLNNQQEIAYTYLVGRHNVANRPIPVTTNYPYDQVSYATTWEIEGAPVIKFGVEKDIGKNFSVGIQARYFAPRTLIEIYDEEQRASGGGWWREYDAINASAIEVKFNLEI